MTFSELGLNDQILKALTDIHYDTCTPIQAQAIEPILQGKDILGMAQTGTGKTAAFALPIIHRMVQQRSKHIRALILTPTRELAIQIFENIRTYSKYTHVKPVVIFGGVSQFHQVKNIQKGVDILIATPGRLLDLVQQQIVDISKIETLVLDEADHMLDIGFIHDIKKVVKQIPADRQTLFFSATMPAEIRKFAHSILRNPTEVAVTPISKSADTVKQHLFHVEKKDKSTLLTNLIRKESLSRTIVFTRTKHGADKLVKQLVRAGISAAAIHGNKSQQARQKALTNFKSDELSILIATDIAARGIDIKELSHVINYDLPAVPETYIHRIGRTGRAGHAGAAISFCDGEQIKELKNIQKLLGFNIEVIQQN